MHSLRILMVTAVFAPCLLGTAAAQVALQPGQDVAVNPAGVRSGQVLLYPGGKMARVVPPLREPNGKYGPIHLHMPSKHRTETKTASEPEEKPAESAAESLGQSDVATAAPAEAAPPPKRRRVAVTPPPAEAPVKTETAKTQPAQAAAASPAMPFTFGEDEGAASPLGPPEPPKAEPAKTAPAKTVPARKIATATPPPAATRPDESAPAADTGKLTKRGVVLFNKDATEPVAAASQGISLIAGNLSDALLQGAERVELLAYGGAPGDKSSDARRLSLKRALTIRQLLIDRGVPSDRIDVRAMGGADSGKPDRVDIFVKTG